MTNINELSLEQQKEIMDMIWERFDKNMNRHEGMKWTEIKSKLQSNPEKLWSLSEMERT
jgi:hypothetical protein